MRKLVTSIGVLALLLALVLPSVAFAGGPNGGQAGTEVNVEDVQIDPNLALAGQLAGIGETEASQAQFGFNESEQENKIDDINTGSSEDGLAAGLNIANVFGKSSATSVAKSGWVVSVGNLQFVNLDNNQDSSADADGDNYVAIIAGDSEAENKGYVDASGGWATSIAAGAESEGGNAVAESGEYEPSADNDVDAAAFGGANAVNVPIASGNAIDATVAASAALAVAGTEAENENEGNGPDRLGPALTHPQGDNDGGSGDPVVVGVSVPVAVSGDASATGSAQGGDAEAEGGYGPASNCIPTTQNLGGSTAATQNGDAGDSWAQNNAGAANANGGTASQNATAAKGGDATGAYIGNFGGTAINMVGDICIVSEGQSDAQSGNATTGANTATTGATVTQPNTPSVNQTGASGAPSIDQSNCNPQEVENEQGQAAVSALAQILAQMQGGNEN